MDETNTRLREARKRAGFKSARGAALRFHWVPSTYASHENGQTPVPMEAAREYARAFKVDRAWLLDMENETAPLHQHNIAHLHMENRPRSLHQNNIASMRPEKDLNELAEVPEFDLKAGVNYGSDGQESLDNSYGDAIAAVRITWGFPTPFLKDELHIRSGRAHILQVRGDSMADALFDGDRAIIDLDDIDVSQGGIFALLDDSASLIIKQVEVVRGSARRKILCSSRNSRYAPFELLLENPVRIVGRVAAKITRL